MGKKGRQFILLGLLIALVLATLLGTFRGRAMHTAIEAHTFATQAAEQRRSFDFVVLEPARTRFNEEKIQQQALIKAGFDEAILAESEIDLTIARARVEDAESTAVKNKALEGKAIEQYAPHSMWYSAYSVIKFSGKLFLNLLNMLVIPLVAVSLMTGILSLGDIRHVGRTGLRTVIYYLVTTAIAVFIGIVLVNLIAPGVGMEESSIIAGKVRGKEATGILDTILRVFVNGDSPAKGAFPKNIIAAMADMNVLGVITFSLLFGAALTTIGERGRVVANFIIGLNEVILKMVHWVLLLLPIGVFGLIVTRLAEVGGGSAVWVELSRLAWYSMTVVLALGIHAVIVIPLILYIFAKRNPLSYLKNLAPALLTAFSTASSSATLPTTMECVEKRGKVSKRAASFVLPIGATINMDGTALYEAVAVIFIAQVYGVPMDMTMLIVIFLTATLAAIGAAGIPEAGLVTMVVVLNATGLPLEGIALLLSIDWLLDRCRTTVNVWGDAAGAAVIDRLEKTEEDEVA
jgi:Na+/H+-dicarboxylate symporter